MQNNNLMYDPDFIASLLQAEGRSQGQAMSDAAIIAHNKQQVLMQQQKHAQEQFMAQQLPKILRELQGKNPYEAAELLARAGLKGPEIGLFLERMGLGKSSNKSDLVTGPGGFKYEEFVNPTGQRELRELPGQTARQSYDEQKVAQKALALEQKETIKDIKVLEEKELAADEILKALEAERDAFEQWDANTGPHTGSGSAMADFTDPSNIKESYWTYAPRKAAQYLFYKDQARAARDKITKINSDLTQEILKGKSRALQTDIGKDVVKQGLPQAFIAGEAREDVIDTFSEKASEAKARSIFIKKWAKAHNDSNKGALDEYNRFKELYGLIDINGRINKAAFNKMDEYIKAEVSNNGDASDEEWEAEARRRNLQ